LFIVSIINKLGKI